MEFLGHLISSAGISLLPEKVRAVTEFLQPQDEQSLRRFLGMLNFYHYFLSGIAHTLLPLVEATKGMKKKLSGQMNIKVLSIKRSLL